MSVRGAGLRKGLGGPLCPPKCPVAWGRAFPDGITPISGTPSSMMGGDQGTGHVTPLGTLHQRLPPALGEGLGGRFKCRIPCSALKSK